VATFKTADNIPYTVKFKSPVLCYLTKKGRPIKMKVDGLCFNPNGRKPKIYIDSKLGNRRKLAVIIEEYVHAHWYDLTEKEVRKFAANLTKMLYTQGWRLSK
jgi:hypothetical protein